MTLATVVLQLNLLFARLTQMPNRLKNVISLMICQFLQDKPFVRNTNTTLTWQLLILFRDKS